MADTTALLLERCVPGAQLKQCLPELEQDEVISSLMRRLWARQPPDGHPFASLQDICDEWSASVELELETAGRGVNSDLARAGAAMLSELARTARRSRVCSGAAHAQLRSAPCG